MNRLLKLIVGTLLVIPVATTFAEDNDKKKKREVPQGYEEAKKAEAPARAVNADVQPDDVAVEVEEMVLDLPEVKVDANVKNLENQFLPQFQPILKSELAFVQRICKLNKTQRKQFAAAADKVLKAAVRRYATVQNDMQRGQWRFGNGRQPTMPEPRKLIEQGMAQLAEKNLGAEQVEIYRQEISKRNEYRKQVAVKGLVVMLDEELVLNAEQREKLVKSLSENWQDAWVQSLQLLMNNGNRYIPNIPTQHIAPILNKPQLAVWRGAQKQNQVFWGGMGFAPAMFVRNAVVFEEEEELAELEPADEDAPDESN